jgi:hypothetical protein
MMRTLILTHRYVGIATCLLFVMWSGSGWEGRWHTVFADDGSVLDRVEPARAIAASQQFSRIPRVRYLGLIERDQWTVPNGLNPYRPLHYLRLEDAAGTEVYLSDRTGEIIRDTTRTERFWNWCGAVLH